jgi:hypothetical protein
MTAFADYTVHRLTQGAPDNDGGLITLTSPTSVVGANVDTGSGSVPFGFTFNFDNTDYTSATAFSDGWLTFSGSSFGNPYNNDQFDDSNATIGLFPWWGDLRTATTGGYVAYQQFGSAPDRYVVIEWNVYGYFNHNATKHRALNYQCVLRETTNNIEFRYDAPTTTGSPSGGDGVVGARVSTTGAVNGNIREFSETTGTPDANGGVSTTPVDMALSWADGGDFPGDPTNAIEGAAFNYHFRATAVSEGGGEGEGEGEGGDTCGNPRIDIAYRVYGISAHRRFQVDWGNPAVSGSPTSVSLDAGLYMSAAELASEIQTQLSAAIATPTWTVTNDADGRFSISVDAGVFTVTSLSHSLRDWLGWDADIATPTASSTADNLCAGVFVGAFPWGNDAVGWRYSRKVWNGHHQRAGALKLAKVRTWEVDATIARGDIAQWRNVGKLLARGMPATWYRNDTDTAAWGWDNFDGKLHVVLESDALNESQLSELVNDNVLRVPLKFTEFTDPAVAAVSDFDSGIVAPELGLRFYAYIQGIGRIFIDGESFIGQDSSAWSAPTDKASQSYTLTPYTLDTSGGIRDVGSEISRRSGEVSPGSITLTLSEDRTGTLLDLFATEKADGLAANLEDDLDYDTAGTGSVLTVDTTTGWPSSGLAYLGRETIYYPATAATTIGTAGSKATRDLFNDVNDTGTTYGDVEYMHNTNRPQGPRVVYDFPRSWAGRWCSVWATLVDPFGRALGTGYKGSTCSEIYRGRISEEPRPSDDWQRWTLPADEISAVLDTEVGREPILGTLLRVPGNAKQNQEAAALSGATVSPDLVASFYVDDSVAKLYLSIYQYTNANWPDTLDSQTNLVVDITPGVYNEASLLDEINTQVQAAIDGSSLSVFPKFQIYVSNAGPSGLRYVVRFESNENPATHRNRFVLEYGGEYSVLKLLGYPSSGSDEKSNTGAEGVLFYPSHPASPVFISEQSLAVPFFYSEDAGINADTAPSAGFARVGGDEGEIVKYSSISDLTGTIPGLYQLNCTVRGAFGTVARQYVVEWGDDWTLSAGEVTVEFGNAFEDVHPLDAILQLAVSTGEASHHGSFDTLLRRTSPPLNPDHFDLDQIAQAKADLDMPPVRMFMTKPRKLSELVAGWLAPFGRFMYSTRDEGLYRIRVGQILPPLESEASTVIDSGAVTFYDPARWQSGLSRVVNQIEIQPTWDVLKEELTDDRVTLEQADSVQDYGRKGKLSWKMIGLSTTALEIAAQSISWANRIFNRLSRPYLVLELSTGRAGLSVRPGDIIDLTLAGVPALDGTRGMSARRAMVLQASYTWETPIESGSSTGATLVVAIEHTERFSTYSPSAYVTGYAAGGPSITIDPTAGLFPSGDKASDHFEAGDKIVVWNPGDYSTRDSLDIVSVVNNVITLSGTLTNASLVTGNTIIEPAAYGTATAEQQKHAFVADSSTVPELSGSAESFKYV